MKNEPTVLCLLAICHLLLASGIKDTTVVSSLPSSMEIMHVLDLYVVIKKLNKLMSSTTYIYMYNCAQVVLWVAIPALLERGSTTAVMTVLLIMFLFQYLPKIYHSVCLLRRMQNLSGYIFGTVWWGIALNMIAYFVASHVRT